jgi:hypothetical protein
MKRNTRSSLRVFFYAYTEDKAVIRRHGGLKGLQTMERDLIETERGSERSFGITFSFVFLAVSGYVFWKSGEVLWWLISAAAILLMITFAYPRLLSKPNELWFKFGILLGRFVAPIVMALVYVTAFLPTGLYIRMTGTDLLGTRLDPDTDSYWIKRETQLQPMKNQF